MSSNLVQKFQSKVQKQLGNIYEILESKTILIDQVSYNHDSVVVKNLNKSLM
jgi:hypothetical protein